MKLPVILFVATGLSTFWVGINHWLPFPFGTSAWQLLFVDWADGLSNMANILRQLLVANWMDGLIYMACLVAILLTHEMGHFLATSGTASPRVFLLHPVADLADWHDGGGDWHGRPACQSSRDVRYRFGGPVGRIAGRGSHHVRRIRGSTRRHMAVRAVCRGLTAICPHCAAVIQPPGYEPGMLIDSAN